MLPLTCPLSYPVPTPCTHPTGANAPVGQDQRAEDMGHGVAKDRSSSAAKHSVTTVICTAASAPKLSTAAWPVAQSTAAIGVSRLVSLTPARATPTPSTSQGTAGASAELPLRDIPGSYSYLSILGMGFNSHAGGPKPSRSSGCYTVWCSHFTGSPSSGSCSDHRSVSHQNCRNNDHPRAG